MAEAPLSSYMKEIINSGYLSGTLSLTGIKALLVTLELAEPFFLMGAIHLVTLLVFSGHLLRIFLVGLVASHTQRCNFHRTMVQ